MTDGDPALNAWVLQWMSHALVHVEMTVGPTIVVVDVHVHT